MERRVKHESHHAGVNVFCRHSHWLLEHHSIFQVLVMPLSQIHSQCKDSFYQQHLPNRESLLLKGIFFFSPWSTLLHQVESDTSGLQKQRSTKTASQPHKTQALRGSRLQFGTPSTLEIEVLYSFWNSLPDRSFVWRFSPGKAEGAALSWSNSLTSTENSQSRSPGWSRRVSSGSVWPVRGRGEGREEEQGGKRKLTLVCVAVELTSSITQRRA